MWVMTPYDGTVTTACSGPPHATIYNYAVDIAAGVGTPARFRVHPYDRDRFAVYGCEIRATVIGKGTSCAGGYYYDAGGQRVNASAGEIVQLRVEPVCVGGGRGLLGFMSYHHISYTAAMNAELRDQGIVGYVGGYSQIIGDHWAVIYTAASGACWTGPHTHQEFGGITPVGCAYSPPVVGYMGG